MYYLKSLAFNFIIIFFADYVLPGIEVSSHTKLPHIGEDLIFAAALGLLNSLIAPVLKLFSQAVTGVRIAVIALILNFAAYGIMKLLPVGVEITSVEGYILASVVVSIGSFLTNFFEMKNLRQKHDVPQ